MKSSASGWKCAAALLIWPAAMAAPFRDAFFFAEQNARLVKNAEEYYRSMFHERISSWNLRDSHMAETLDALTHHLGRQGKDRRLGAQLSSGRCSRHRDGTTGRTESRTTCAPALRQRSDLVGFTPTPARSPQHRDGTLLQNANMFDQH